VTDSPATRQGITWMEWLGVAAGVVALVVSFLPWYRLSAPLERQAESQGAQTWITVWQGNFLAWFPVVLLLAACVLILWQRFGKPLQMLSSLWLTLAALAVAMILLRWITAPDGIRSGYGLYLGLIAAVVSGVAGFLAFRGTARANPGR
jgi:hypothetical protein